LPQIDLIAVVAYSWAATRVLILPRRPPDLRNSRSASVGANLAARSNAAADSLPGRFATEAGADDGVALVDERPIPSRAILVGQKDE
jgi:hypothetical protein